ncbi:MAG TPA: DUF6520 family protein [Flavisolibacter sp.]|nr:DUF6520 family protein [Flavisolibacter sp.]
MKKYTLTMIAAVMAIALSAFTSNKSLETVWYQVDESGPWYSTLGDPCPSGDVPDCRIQTPHGTQKIFDAQNGNPFKRP